MTRRLPPPWRADKFSGGYVVRDANGFHSIGRAKGGGSTSDISAPMSRPSRRASSTTPKAAILRMLSGSGGGEEATDQPRRQGDQDPPQDFMSCRAGARPGHPISCQKLRKVGFDHFLIPFETDPPRHLGDMQEPVFH